MKHGAKFCHLLQGLLPILLGFLAVGGLLLGAQPASAQSCIQDVWKAHGNTQSLTCTANDVQVAFADHIRGLDGQTLTQCTSGTTFSFIADFHVVLTAQTRYDIGLYFATDGDPNHNGATTGTCDANVILPPFTDPNIPGVTFGSANFVQLDSGGDTCGEIDATHNPQVVTVKVDNALCVDSDGDGNVNLPNCTSWRTSGQNALCTSSFDAFPGSPSKCNCDIGFNVPIFVETGTIEVTKDVTDPANATRDEPGGQFTYTVTVENTATVTSVTLDKICDDKYGTIANATGTACPAGTVGSIDSTTCTVPQPLAHGASYSCTFKATFTANGPTSLTDTVTVSGLDENNKPVSDSDSAQVFIADVAPNASVVKSFDSLRCATVRYGVRVNNLDPAESLNLSVLTDDTFGSITSVHGDVVATTCAVPQTIAVGGNYPCTFDAQFCASSHTDKVTGTLNDNDGNTVSRDSNELTVNVSAP